jgi:hypothetical protein
MTNDRRTNNRSLTAALAEVYCRNKRFVGVVEDLSCHGACLHMENELPVHQQVVVFIGEVFRVCTVRHCKAEDEGFRVGLAFMEPWPENLNGLIYQSELLGGEQVSTSSIID